MASFVREDGRPISRIEPSDVIERRVHGPASDGYLTIVSWRQIGGRAGEWFPGAFFELSPAQQAGLLEILAGCRCNPADRTGGGHDPRCPEFEPECTCYEMIGGHQPMCPAGVAVEVRRTRGGL